MELTRLVTVWLDNTDVDFAVTADVRWSRDTGWRVEEWLSFVDMRSGEVRDEGWYRAHVRSPSDHEEGFCELAANLGATSPCELSY